MNKLLLAFTILAAGAGGFTAARQSTTQLQQEANGARETWLAQTQLVAAAASDQVELTERVRELKQSLRQTQVTGENPLWSALQANDPHRLTPELRERLLEELGFNWKSSDEFIVVSKETLRDYLVSIATIRGDKLTDVASTALAMTPAERAQVDAAIERARTDYKDWVLSHTERSEPTNDVLAQYTLHGDPTLSISNNFGAALFNAVGGERAELIGASARSWMSSIGILNEKPLTMIVTHYSTGNEQRLKVKIPHPDGGGWSSGDVPKYRFPEPFLPVFPNGWADVAEREGFKLPKEVQKK